MNDFADYAEPLLSELNRGPDGSSLVDDWKPPMFLAEGMDVSSMWRLPERDEWNWLSERHPGDLTTEEDRKAAQGAYPMLGMDVLAFYKSFRFKKQQPCQGNWGIFLLSAGIAGLTDEFRVLASGVSRTELKRLAIETLVAHERYHFWIDVWALIQEILPFNVAVEHYPHYLREKASIELTGDDLEESLANHYAFQKLRRRKFSNGTRASQVLRQVLASGPQPYSDFDFDSSERAQREAVLAYAVANGMRPDIARATAVLRFAAYDTSVLSTSLRPLPPRHPIAGSAMCPVHYIRVSNYAQLVQPFQGPKIGELRAFMTNYLAGKAERTDHIYYKIDNGEKVKFPNPHDKEVRGDELKHILYKAGMYQKDFNSERARTQKWSEYCPRDPVRPSLGCGNGR